MLLDGIVQIGSHAPAFGGDDTRSLALSPHLNPEYDERHQRQRKRDSACHGRNTPPVDRHGRNKAHSGGRHHVEPRRNGVARFVELVDDDALDFDKRAGKYMRDDACEIHALARLGVPKLAKAHDLAVQRRRGNGDSRGEPHMEET